MLERAGLLPPSCSWGKGRDWLRGISPDSDTVLLSPEPDTLSEPFLQNVRIPAQHSSVYKPTFAIISAVSWPCSHGMQDRGYTRKDTLQEVCYKTQCRCAELQAEHLAFLSSLSTRLRFSAVVSNRACNHSDMYLWHTLPGTCQ